MGQRGPIGNPAGVRAQRARKARSKSNGATSAPQGSTPVRPAWLPEDAAAVWDAVLCDLQSAGVPVARIDGHSIGMFVLTVLETQKASAKGDTKTAARFGRDLIQWANAIGATPAARLRMGIRKEQEWAENPWRMLAAGVPSTGNAELDAILSTPRISRETNVKQ